MAEVYAVFTDVEKAKIRTHLGYHSVSPVYSIVLGVPASTQPMFLVEGAMERVLVAAGPRVRELICQLDRIECQLKEATEFMVASKLGSMELREDYSDKLEAEYLRWARRLSDELGAPINPFSERFSGGKAPLNIRVLG